MHWLRSTWRLRAVVLLFAVGLLPVALVWPQQAAPRTPAEAHADWLRAQVRGEMDDAERDAFEAALQTAVEREDAHSLRDFLHYFASAYAQHAPGASLVQLFGVAEGMHGQVADALQRHLAQATGWAAVPRLTTTLQATLFSSSHHSPSGTAVLPLLPSAAAFQRTVAHIADRAPRSGLVRVLLALRPRAP